jgi:hypothetical protein
MRKGRERFVRAMFAVGWAGALALALRTGATAIDVNPEQLLGLLATGYLAAWGLVFFLSRHGAEGNAARFLACTGAILAGVAVFEALAWLHVVDYRVVFQTPTPPWRRPGYRPDPELIFAKLGPRHTREVFRGAELHRLRGAVPGNVYECDLRLDRDGFRNPVDLRSSDLVVVGDSFVEGLHVAADELLTARLSRALGQTVANLGRSGYGPQQELHVLRRYGLPLRPQTCVWAFYEGNDLQDVNAYDSYQKDLRWILAEGQAQGLYGRSLTRNLLALAIRCWLRPEPSLPAQRYCGQFASSMGAPLTMYFASGIQHGAGGPPLPRGNSQELSRVRAILGEAHNLCQRQGVDLVVVFVPTKFRVYRDHCSFGRDALCREWAIDDLPDALGGALSAVSPAIGYFDLTPHLRTAAARGALLYLPDDPHWSAAGHRAAAGALADYLRSRASRPPHSYSSEREVERLGD